jgi:integrase
MKGVSIEVLKRDLEIFYRPPLGAVATFKVVRQILDELQKSSEVLLTTDITPTALVEWVTKYPKGPANARKLLGSLRHACNYAQLKGWLTVSPFAFRPMEKWIVDDRDDDEQEFNEQTRHHPLEDLTRVIRGMQAEAAGSWHAHRLFALATTTFLTGARAKEVQGAKITDFQLTERWFLVRVNERRRLKTKKSKRRVPMPLELVSVLAEWLPRSLSPWAFPGVMRLGPWLTGCDGYRPVDKLKAVGERYGVEGLTFQSLRHSYITHSEGPWGIPNLITQRIAGHTRPETTAGYRGFDRANLQSAIEPISLGLMPMN